MSGRLPGDPSARGKIERMVRVDHAGEQGARRIYDGQLAVLGKSAAAPAIRRMADQEKRHLARFDKMLVKRRVRPTVLSPLWHVAGFTLGATSALLGERAAMACTVAVEEAIDTHYAQQIEALGDSDAELKSAITEFRADELEHRDVALAHGAEDAPAYPVMTGLIKIGARAAIWLSERF